MIVLLNSNRGISLYKYMYSDKTLVFKETKPPQIEHTLSFPFTQSFMSLSFSTSLFLFLLLFFFFLFPLPSSFSSSSYTSFFLISHQNLTLSYQLSLSLKESLELVVVLTSDPRYPICFSLPWLQR